MNQTFRPQIEPTADGSVTLYRPDLDEHYHSVKGALAESLHIYLDLGWRVAGSRPGKIRVFEVGFGTGLNAALTAKAADDESRFTEYYSVEKYPVDNELTERLIPYQSDAYLYEFQKVNSAEWNRDVQINSHFTLHKMEDDLLSMSLPPDIDVVYFDAFAPDKQPDIWDEAVFRKIYDAMAPGGILTTYCAKGSVRRLLQKTGFRTERLPGPPGGKREVLRATKPSSEVAYTGL